MKFPAEHRSYDTLDQHIYVAAIEQAEMDVSIIKNMGEFAVDLKSDKDLEEYYKGTAKGVVNALHAELVSDSIVLIDGLKSNLISIRLKMAGQDQMQYYLFFIARNTTYSILFKELESADSSLQSIRQEYFSSIHLHDGITSKDQYKVDIKDSIGYKIGYALGAVMIPIALLVIIGLIVLIVLVRRNRKIKKSIPPEFL